MTVFKLLVIRRLSQSYNYLQITIIHHPVVPLAWISQALPGHSSLSSITTSHSSKLHPMSVQSHCR